MKALIVNSKGYFPQILRERLYKDSYEIFCLQNDLEADEFVADSKVHYLTLPYSNSLLEYFRLYNFDAVFYVSSGLLDISSQAVNLAWEQVLAHCVQFKVRRATYITQEDFTSQNLQAVNHETASALCEAYTENGLVDAKYIEFSEVFAAEMHQGLVNNILLEDSKKADEDIETFNVNLVCVDDAVDIVIKLWQQKEYKFYPKAPNSNVSYEELYKFVKAVDSDDVVPELTLDNPGSAELEAINWHSKFKLADKLKDAVKQSKQIDQETEQKRQGLWKNFYPYIENLCLFTLLAIFVFTFQDGYSVNSYTEADITYLYILIMGLLYGKQQALPAIVLSTLLYFTSHICHGSTFVAMMYQPQTMLHIACYLFFGTAVGYVTDNRDYTMENMENQVKYLKDKYNYLFKNYLEVVKIKDGLYRQIINSNDSIGRIYNITKRLDTLKVENLYMETCAVVSEVMHIDDVAVYGYSGDRGFLRLRANTAGYCEKLPMSVNVKEYPELEGFITNQSVFVNKDMLDRFPDMSVPVYSDDKCLGIICLYNMQFDDFNLHNEVLLKVIASLVANAFKKANEYERAMHDVMYIENTVIMKAEYFADKCADFEKLAKENLKYQRARLVNIGSIDEMSAVEFSILSNKLNKIVRYGDIVGVREDRHLEFLYYKLDSEFKPNVEKRMQKEGISIEWLS